MGDWPPPVPTPKPGPPPPPAPIPCEPEPPKATFASKVKAFWMWLKSNQYFVAASSALSAFVAKAAYNWVESGSPAISVVQLKQTAIAAIGVAIVAIYHLYTNNPTRAAEKAAQQ